jgi:hypothetical protein
MRLIHNLRSHANPRRAGDRLERAREPSILVPRSIVAALALRAEPGGGLPTLSQYLLDPPYAYGVLGSEFLKHLLCGEFRMALPDRTDADSSSGAPIQLPRHPSQSGTACRGRFPTVP